MAADAGAGVQDEQRCGVLLRRGAVEGPGARRSQGSGVNLRSWRRKGAEVASGPERLVVGFGRRGLRQGG